MIKQLFLLCEVCQDDELFAQSPPLGKWALARTNGIVSFLNKHSHGYMLNEDFLLIPVKQRQAPVDEYWEC